MNDDENHVGSSELGWGVILAAIGAAAWAFTSQDRLGRILLMVGIIFAIYGIAKNLSGEQAQKTPPAQQETEGAESDD